ncbi:MAG: type II toxin-antitoxin system RelE/ParE family toxin [Bacteroidota bacterium]|nr:type II toxin-antitoxin system RelE/ParE family toxin [Bacteroidota bacterium]
MPYKILPFAEIDLQESVDWYALRQPGLEADLLTDTRKTIQFINQNPYAYQVKYKRKGLQIRKAPANRFPFVVVYFIDENVQCIIIIAIWHTSRNPKKIKKRL